MTPLALLTLAAFTSITPANAHVDLGATPGVDARKAYAAELAGDAAGRTSLLADEGSSGFVKGKFTLSDGGPNTLMIGGFIQSRYQANFRDTASSDSDYTGGFQINRARLKFNGSVWDKAFTYNILTELVSSSGSATLLYYEDDTARNDAATQVKRVISTGAPSTSPIAFILALGSKTVTINAFITSASYGASVGEVVSAQISFQGSGAATGVAI